MRRWRGFSSHVGAQIIKAHLRGRSLRGRRGKCLFTNVIRQCGAPRGPAFQVQLLKLQMYNQMFLPPAEEEKHLYFPLFRVLAGGAPLPFISRQICDGDFSEAGNPRFRVSVKGRAGRGVAKGFYSLTLTKIRINEHSALQTAPPSVLRWQSFKTS